MNFERTQKKLFAISILLIFLITPLQSQIMVDSTTEFTSSNLPIIFINTDSLEIPSTPRIPAHMGIIFNGPENRNQVSDFFNNYDGPISIETRGSLAEAFPKKSYRFETQDTLGVDVNVSLLGMPSENDWILYAPIIDRSMIRNVLAFGISNDIGRYASRTHYCELIINNEYRGVYVLMEKIKRDNDRVDISRTDADDAAGDSLTGGYIIKIDKTSGENVGGWTSDMGQQYQYDYPKPDRITEPQQEYISGFINDFEAAMADSNNFNDSDNGYPAFIDAGSFVDHFILNELFRNIDAYRISVFLHKKRDSDGGKLHAGPVWDFNLSAFLAFFRQDIGVTEGWVVDYNITHPEDGFLVPFWWEKLAHDTIFIEQASQRWSELRSGVLDSDELMGRMDNLFETTREARIREWLKWSGGPFGFEFIGQDSTLLKLWFPLRLAWLDQQFGYITGLQSTRDLSRQPQLFELKQNYPNPFNPITTITYQIGKASNVELSVYNILGQNIATLVSKKQTEGTYNVQWDATGFSSGVYFYKLETDKGFTNTKKLVLLK